MIDIHKKLLGSKVYCTDTQTEELVVEVKDEEYFIVQDEFGKKREISMYFIRSIKND